MKSALTQLGSAPIALLIALIISITTAAVLYTQNTQSSNPQKITPLPSPTPILPTPSPSPNPTHYPTPSPTAPLSPVLSPKPLAQTPITSSPNNGFSRVSVQTERGTFVANIITLDISAKMITDTASDSNCTNDCPTLSLADYVSRNGGFAGINGTYFCPTDYSECESKKNSFDFPIWNTRLGKWINEDKLFWNDRSMIYQAGGQMRFLRNANSGAGSPAAGIANYPGLLDNGEIIVSQSGLSSKLQGKGTKGGIGFNDSKIYLVIASNVDSLDFAHLFKNIGAKFALNLDGGGSAALWYGGAYKVGPGRSLPNAVVFK